MQLKAGQLEMIYDHGFLRYIKLGNHEVLRMIYFALRDHNWDTMPGILEDEKIVQEERSFHISYRWISTNENFPFVWHVSLEGKETGEIIFSIKGSAQKDVRKNRTGFCILHSIKENAGGPCLILQPNGQQKEAIFPQYISPHQPFFEIVEMQWPLANLGNATLQFSGDIFETEDQRNWSDDSYKTYCTPLRLPFPAVLKKDEIVQQTVRLSVKQNAGMQVPASLSQICVLEPGPIICRKPKIGIGAPSMGYFLAEDEKELIRNLHFDHYRVEIHFADKGWRAEWERRMAEAIMLKLDLELCLIFTDRYPEELPLFLDSLANIPSEIKTYILILHQDHKTTPTGFVENVISKLGKLKGHFLFGAGTSAYFTELNRVRVDTEGLQFVSYSVNPQVHAFDNASMTENAGAQVYTVESARHYFPGQKIHVSPITLSPRFNPNATVTEVEAPVDLPPSVDLRQMDLFGAAWTLASLRHLAEAGADHITYFQASGWQGIMQGNVLPPMPDLFPARPKMLFPMFHIFQCFLSHKALEWIPFSSSSPLSLKAMGFKAEGRLTFLLANYENKSVEGHLQYPCSRYKLFIFDDNNLVDSYFDADFLTTSLERSPLQTGPFPTLLITANAIIYAELFD